MVSPEPLWSRNKAAASALVVVEACADMQRTGPLVFDMGLMRANCVLSLSAGAVYTRGGTLCVVVQLNSVCWVIRL